MLNQTKNAMKSNEKGYRQLQDEFNKAKAEEEKLIRDQQDLEKIVRDRTIQYERLKAEAKVAESIQKGYSSAVGAVLEARDRGMLKGIHGTIAELATVSREYETALNIAAGSRMQSVVVDDDECAAKAIGYLKQKKIGRATFLPMNKMIEGKPRGKALMVSKDSSALGFAIDLVKFKEEYRAAFSYVLGDTLVMKDLTAARSQMGGVRLVTLDGELIEPAGAMVGGAVGKSQLSFGIPTQNEISKAGAELSNVTEELGKTEKAVATVREKLRELEEKVHEMTGKSDVSVLKLDEFEKRAKDARLKFEKITAELKQKNAELSKCQESLARHEKARDERESSLAELRKKKELVEKKGVEILPERLQKKILDMTRAVASLREEVNRLEFERQTLDGQMGGQDQRLKEYSEKLSKNEQGAKENKKNVERHTKEMAAFREELEVLQKTQAGTEGKIKGLYEDKIKLIEEKATLEADCKQIAEKLDVKRDSMTDNQVRLKEAEGRLAEIMVEVQGYRLDETQKLPSFEYLKTTIAECEQGITAMGDVNMKALDDYDIQKKRADELKTETGRLENEKKDLLTLVAELTEKKKDGLYKVFNPINENLKDVYSKLSNGGTAELVMEYPEEPFKGGITMKVKPPDKKTTSIMMLSGGEQSLAALSFIIAIQQYDPSPFYVLDEVDQNLDAVNAERGAKYIAASSKNAQFIQISLRMATLNVADHLIGVTIQKNGISDVVMKVNISDVNEKGEISGHPSARLESAAGSEDSGVSGGGGRETAENLGTEVDLSSHIDKSVNAT
jgi:chromosome segregation protein